jgi:hypothetical protein
MQLLWISASDHTGNMRSNGISFGENEFLWVFFFFLQCGVDIFKKEGDVYKKMEFAIAPHSCCNTINNENFKKAMEKQNVPKECPMKVVSRAIPVVGRGELYA